MAIRDDLLVEYQREIGLTRRMLAASQALSPDWHPHDKSRAAGALIAHVADVPAWGARILDVLTFDVDTLPADDGAPATHDISVQHFERHAAVTGRLLDKTDAEWLAVWCLTRGDDEFYAMPRRTAFRRLVLNHLIHHRGQLSVYLRMNGAVVPAMYGDTADEPFPT